MNNTEYICGMTECIINAGDADCGMNINGYIYGNFCGGRRRGRCLHGG